MTDIKSMTLPELTEALRAMGEPAFRGKQVFTWLHKGIQSYDEMGNVPKGLREKLVTYVSQKERQRLLDPEAVSKSKKGKEAAEG